jgi:hypothetical protein
VQKSPLYADILILVTYDENGGYWDHRGGLGNLDRRISGFSA